MEPGCAAHMGPIWDPYRLLAGNAIVRDFYLQPHQGLGPKVWSHNVIAV